MKKLLRSSRAAKTQGMKLNFLTFIVWIFMVAIVSSCAASDETTDRQVQASGKTPSGAMATAVFAGGCFWCMEPPFDQLDGVIATTSGYAGGTLSNPTYRQVTAGGSGHLEVVQITYDPSIVSYAQLLAVFWRNVDPFDAHGQFCDRGESYTTAILTNNDAENLAAVQSRERWATTFKRDIATRVLPLNELGFFVAEKYHQDYYRKNPLRYKYYRKSCGRDARLEDVWADQEIRADQEARADQNESKVRI